MNPLPYLYIFFQSNLLEIPIYWFFYKKFAGGRKTISLVTYTNLMTHPIVFFGFFSSGLSYIQATLCAELFAIVTEALVHWGVLRNETTFRKTFDASLLANLVSWQVAPLITYVLFFRG